MNSFMKRLYNLNWKNIGKAMLIFGLFLVIDYIIIIPVILFHIDNIDGPIAVILNTLKSVVLMFILFLIYRKQLIKDWDKFRSNLFDNLDIGVKYWFVGLVGMVIANMIINFVFAGGGANNEENVQEFINYLPWMMLINAGFIAPFNEEMVFRKSLKDAIPSKWGFVLTSAFIFGLMHIIGSYQVWTDFLYIIPYGFLGGAFALAYYKTNTIFTSYALHMLHNTVLIIFSIIGAGIILF